MLSEKDWIQEKKGAIKSEDTMFTLVEFNLLNWCNQRCGFCPTGIDPPKIQHRMSIDLYINVLEQLQELDYEGEIGISGFSEPTLHDCLSFFIHETRSRLPKTEIAVNTNGTLLGTNTIEKLFKEGLDKLSISVYTNGDHYRYLEQIAIQSGHEERIFLRKRYDDSTIWNNRAGAIKSVKELPIHQVCYYPFYTVYINWNGDIQFCSNEPRGLVTLGNVEHDRIIDAWYSEQLNDIRRELANNKRDHLPCRYCDVPGNVMGEENYEAWKKSGILEQSLATK